MYDTQSNTRRKWSKSQIKTTNFLKQGSFFKYRKNWTNKNQGKLLETSLNILTITISSILKT